jgi:NADH-quinone oxidoreductase subunit L
MFLAAGAGAYVAAIFHVVTHAFFKACLFLAAGSVIHACHHEQDIRKLGGLKQKMPTTYLSFLAATLAISGIPIFAGFFSKDAILAKVFEAGATDLNDFGTVYFALWLVALAGAFLTAFYMFRLLFLTFHGEFRGEQEAAEHIRESPWTMTAPLQVLGVLSVIGGLIIGFPEQLFGAHGLNLIERFLGPIVWPIDHGAAAHAGHAVSLQVEWLLVFLSVAVAGAGFYVARRFYFEDPEHSRPQRLAEQLGGVHRLLLNKYWIDELYEAIVVKPLLAVCALAWKVVDVLIIDIFFVNGAAFLTELSGDLLKFMQTGNVRNYALSVAIGIAVLAAILW